MDRQIPKNYGPIASILRARRPSGLTLVRMPLQSATGAFRLRRERPTLSTLSQQAGGRREPPGPVERLRASMHQPREEATMLLHQPAFAGRQLPPTATPLLAEALQAKHLILSTAGQHARQAWQAIIDRKRDDTARVGHTVWVTNSQATRPDAVQSFCADYGASHVIFISRRQPNKPGPESDDPARSYSPDQRSWSLLHPGLSEVTGLRTRFTTGLWFEELEQVLSGSLDLASFVKQDGLPLTGFSNISSAYPVRQVAAVREGPYNILAVGRLASPFAVYLRRH
jgi:hypothetical protein